MPVSYVHGLMTTLAGLLLPLAHDHGLEVLALGHLGLDVGDEILEVWLVLAKSQCPGCRLELIGALTSSGLVHSSLGSSVCDMECCISSVD